MKFKTKTLAILLSLTLVLGLVLTGCGGQPTASQQPAGDNKAAGDKVKVAFVYVGPVGDAGYTYAHDQGRKYLEKEMPNVETSIVESVPEGADAERVLTELATKGNKIIFATSFGYMDYVIKVAQKFPDVTFLHCSGYKTAPNVGTYFGRIYQARYLSGLVAGKQSKSNVIGYVAAMPIPEVIRGINAFTLGVREANPNATVKVVWTNTWYDPAKEKDAAKSLLDAGADVIAQHQDTPAPMQAAEEKGKFGVGYNTDMSSFAPKAVLTGPVWNWGPYYVKTVKAVVDKTWKSEQYWGPMSDKVVDLAPYGPMVSDDAKALVAKKKESILKGEWDVFNGPIKDQSGQVKVPEGSKMTDKEMLEFNWFVQGVDGTIPK
ncbi:BMP family ABC transporter substrate-binding protein [Heliobacterium gestii]|uniref:BMP family ABC transporter substrate-binding protein n=1 Tax=Heliomicrobium gestii TaxID=2699 RepID=A0A845LHG5_HELGE|nr:BMP family ABC transporter substrate-binding protein [Heliomicrobium gestii]MBM7866878.1 basic membrane protein A [Heliomicrobium gestii]MZP42306.1 BMP family ABC transporter substrate-binding protein [Heliomicrobium gestii]